MTGQGTAAAVAGVLGLGAAIAALSRRTISLGAPLTESEVRNFAGSIIRNFNLRVDDDQVVRIAWIESAFDPSALRLEPHINDASAGLMQTLVSTAQWLATDMGYEAFGVPKLANLMSPQTSIYFGSAYLQYLSNYRGRRRSEEWMVRSYNGGPGHSRASTDRYWQRYREAKRELG